MAYANSRSFRVGMLVWLAGATVTGSAVRAQNPPVPPDTVRQADSTHIEARDITGVWEGTFRLDSTWRLARGPARRTVEAVLRFDPVGDASPTTSSPRSVHSGTFEIDFERFGFSLATSAALGWSVSGESMRAILNPTVDVGRVELEGTFHGDRIVGTWRYTAGDGGARGAFELTKSARR